MTFAQFSLQLWENHVGALNMSLVEPIQQIVIRTETGDADVAAIWRDGNTLILDLGQPVENTAYCPEHNRDLPCLLCQRGTD